MIKRTLLTVLAAAVLAWPAAAPAQVSQTFAFPSNDSTVVSSVEVTGAEIGFFWSISGGTA
jgi:hypothetical protein